MQHIVGWKTPPLDSTVMVYPGNHHSHTLTLTHSHLQHSSVVNLSLVRDEQLVSAMLLGNTLQRKDSQLALMLKGFQVHDVVFNVVYNGNRITQ